MFPLPFGLSAVDEETRLRTLSAYDLAQSLREAAFTEFVHLTAYVFETPISLIGFINAEQVTYKAAEGLPALRSQPRQQAICALLVQRNQAVVLTDLTQPAHYQQLPPAAYAHVRAQQYRFYAGVPLRLEGQHVLGSLCIVDRQPHCFGLAELRVLEQLAHLVERLFVVRHACRATTPSGAEAWRNIQAFVAAKLRALGTRVGHALRQRRRPAASDVGPAAGLWMVVNELNALSLVLAEPLPG